MIGENLVNFLLQVIQMNIQEDIRKQIVQELKINQASQCPHVVVCYHSFYHNGVISLVLEYMDRGSLVDVIRQVNTILEPYLAVVCKQVPRSYFYFFLVEIGRFSPIHYSVSLLNVNTLRPYCRCYRALFTCTMKDM